MRSSTDRNASSSPTSDSGSSSACSTDWVDKTGARKRLRDENPDMSEMERLMRDASKREGKDIDEVRLQEYKKETNHYFITMRAIASELREAQRRNDKESEKRHDASTKKMKKDYNARLKNDYPEFYPAFIPQTNGLDIAVWDKRHKVESSKQKDEDKKQQDRLNRERRNQARQGRRLGA